MLTEESTGLKTNQITDQVCAGDNVNEDRELRQNVSYFGEKLEPLYKSWA